MMKGLVAEYQVHAVIADIQRRDIAVPEFDGNFFF